MASIAIVKNTGTQPVSQKFNGNEYTWKPGEEKRFRKPVAKWFEQKHFVGGKPGTLRVTGEFAPETMDGEEIVASKTFKVGVGMGPADVADKAKTEPKS